LIGFVRQCRRQVLGEEFMMTRCKQGLVLSACILALTLTGVGQKKSDKPGGATVDKGYLQEIWDGWGAMKPADQARFYAKGPHVFFDIAPVKYESWDEYQAGVTKVLSGFKAATFKVNDDAQIHKAGDSIWITATVAADMTEQSGKRDLSTMRWTAVFQKDGGKWLIVHEHVSEPIQ
jgi:ketosteroid isomerase-like protein